MMKSLARTLSITGVLLALALVSACQAPVAPTKEPPRPTPIPPAATPGQPSAQTAWQGGAHAATFVEGENNDCARCHAPMNWTPTDPADMPATCASCKFTIKTPKPVAKADWQSVTCDVCHVVENKALTSKVARLNAAIAQFDSSQSPYEAVRTPDDLCAGCHADIRGMKYGRSMGSAAHASLGCTKCHDAHSLAASCIAAGCHPGVLTPAKPIAGHDAAHAAVSCGACHDASGLKAGPVEGSKAWSTFRASDARGKAVATAYTSHALQKKADCARCHFSGNPWGLKIY